MLVSHLRLTDIESIHFVQFGPKLSRYESIELFLRRYHSVQITKSVDDPEWWTSTHGTADYVCFMIRMKMKSEL